MNRFALAFTLSTITLVTITGHQGVCLIKMRRLERDINSLQKVVDDCLEKGLRDCAIQFKNGALQKTKELRRVRKQCFIPERLQVKIRRIVERE
jgi:hypothetical protein